jgi:GTP-binding protein
MDGPDPVENFRGIRSELEQYSRALADKAEVVVANKIDLVPDSEIVNEIAKKLNKKIHAISAVTGAGIKGLCEALWERVKESKT